MLLYLGNLWFSYQPVIVAVVVRARHIAARYGIGGEELLRLERHWNEILKFEGLAVSNDHMGRRSWPRGGDSAESLPLDSILIGGQWFQPGYPYILKTKRTPKNPRCYHRPLQDMEFSPLEFYLCGDCGRKLSDEDCGHVNQGKTFGKKKRVKSKYRAVPTAGDDTPNDGSNALDPRGEFDVKEITETDGQYIAKFEWMWKFNGRAEPVPVVKRGWNWKDIVASSAPEIEYRVQRAALRYFDLAPQPRYRAPHARVRELQQAGLTQQQIARRLKVSERTIRARLEELPPLPPKEVSTATVADLLPLIVARGGGWAKGNSWQRWTKKPFWPGGDSLPQGSTEANPSETGPPAPGYYKNEDQRLASSAGAGFLG